MKIAIVYIGSRGGGTLDTLEIAASLSQSNGNNVSIVVSRNNELIKRYQLLGVAIHGIATHKRSYGDLLLQTVLIARPLVLFRLLAKEKPSVILFIMDHPWIWLLFPLLKRALPQTCFMYIRHNQPGFAQTSNDIYNWLSDKFSVVMLGSDYIFTFSAYVRSQLILKHKGVAQRIIALSHPPYGQLFSSQEKEKRRNLHCNPLEILFFGRMAPYKGLDILIAAYELVVSKGMSIRLTVAGEGRIDCSLQGKMKRLDVQVKNYWLADDEMRDLFITHDVLVLPYTTVSQSGPASIARAYGMPIIASRVGGLVEQIRDGIDGVFVPPNDMSALADVIGRMVSYGADSMIECCDPRPVDARHSWDAIGHHIKRLAGV